MPPQVGTVLAPIAAVRALGVARGSSDATIVQWAEAHGAEHNLVVIIVTRNTRDFRRMVSRVSLSRRRRFPRVGLLGLECSDRREVDRVRDALSLLETELETARGAQDPRVFVTIRPERVIIER